MRERPSASSVVAAVLARSALSLRLEKPDLYNEFAFTRERRRSS